MSGAQVRITVQDDALKAAFARLTATGDAGLLRAALKNIGVQLAKATQQRFVDQKAPDGAPWTPLNPDYAATKKGPGILRESGALQASIAWQLQGDDAVAVGTDRIYAAIHQFGGEIRAAGPALAFKIGGKDVIAKSATMPARPFLGASEDDKAEIIRVIEDHAAAVWSGTP